MGEGRRCCYGDSAIINYELPRLTSPFPSLSLGRSCFLLFHFSWVSFHTATRNELLSLMQVPYQSFFSLLFSYKPRILVFSSSLHPFPPLLFPSLLFLDLAFSPGYT